MTILGWVQIALYIALILLITRPLGGYLTRVISGERTVLSPVLLPIERAFYRAGGVDPRIEQHWLTYALAMLLFNGAGLVLLYGLQRLQGVLPLNPQGMPAVPADLALNTAISFVTNTNWQNYGGETTMGYLVQMAGLTVQNFLSAATGIALAVALIRGFARQVGRDHRQLLGRSHPDHPLRAAAAVRRHRAAPGLAGHAADARALRAGDDAGGRAADHRHRPGRQPGRDQDARHQRRRLLQRQLPRTPSRTRRLCPT